MLLRFLILSVIKKLILGQLLSSPCPEYFRYVNDASGTHGIIEVPSRPPGETLHIRIELSLKALVQHVSCMEFLFELLIQTTFYSGNNQYGSMELLDPPNVVEQSIRSGQNLRYKVTFPLQNPLPKLTQILYNGQLICSGPAESVRFGGVTTINLEYTYTSPKVTRYYFQPNSQPHKKVNLRPPLNYPTERPAQLPPSVRPPLTTSIRPIYPDIQWDYSTERPAPSPPSRTTTTIRTRKPSTSTQPTFDDYYELTSTSMER